MPGTQGSGNQIDSVTELMLKPLNPAPGQARRVQKGHDDDQTRHQEQSRVRHAQDHPDEHRRQRQHERTDERADGIDFGVGLSSLAGALMALILNFAPNPFSLSDLVNWTLGSVANRSLADLAMTAPLILVGADLPLRPRGRLADLAPTVLTLLDVPIPPEMSGEPLVG